MRTRSNIQSHGTIQVSQSLAGTFGEIAASCMMAAKSDRDDIDLLCIGQIIAAIGKSRFSIVCDEPSPEAAAAIELLKASLAALDAGPGKGAVR